MALSRERNIFGGCQVNNFVVHVGGITFRRHPLSLDNLEPLGALSMLLHGTVTETEKVRREAHGVMTEYWNLVVLEGLATPDESPEEVLERYPLTGPTLNEAAFFCFAQKINARIHIYYRYGENYCDKTILGPLDGIPEHILVNEAPGEGTTTEVIYHLGDPYIPYREDMEAWHEISEEMSSSLVPDEEQTVEPFGLEKVVVIETSNRSLQTTKKEEKGKSNQGEESSPDISEVDSAEDKSIVLEESKDEGKLEKKSTRNKGSGTVKLFGLTDSDPGDNSSKLSGSPSGENIMTEVSEGTNSGSERGSSPIDTDMGTLGKAKRITKLSSVRAKRLAREMRLSKAKGTSDQWLPPYPTLNIRVTGSDSEDRSSSDPKAKPTYAEMVRTKTPRTSPTSPRKRPDRQSITIRDPGWETADVSVRDTSGEIDKYLKGYTWDPEEHKRKFGTKGKTTQASTSRTEPSVVAQRPPTWMVGESSRRALEQEKAHASKAPEKSPVEPLATEVPATSIMLETAHDKEKKTPGTSSKTALEKSPLQQHMETSPKSHHDRKSQKKQKREADLSQTKMKKILKGLKWDDVRIKHQDDVFWKGFQLAQELGIPLDEVEMSLLAEQSVNWEDGLAQIENLEQVSQNLSRLLAESKKTTAATATVTTTEQFPPEYPIGTTPSAGPAIAQGVKYAEGALASMGPFPEEVVTSGEDLSTGLPASTKPRPKPYIPTGKGKKGLKHGLIRDSDEDLALSTDQEGKAPGGSRDGHRRRSKRETAKKLKDTSESHREGKISSPKTDFAKSDVIQRATAVESTATRPRISSSADSQAGSAEMPALEGDPVDIGGNIQSPFPDEFEEHDEIVTKMTVGVRSITRTVEKMIGTLLTIPLTIDAHDTNPIMVKPFLESESKYRYLTDFLTNCLINIETLESGLFFQNGLVFHESVLLCLDLGSFIQLMGKKYFSLDAIQYITKKPFLDTLHIFLILGICKLLNGRVAAEKAELLFAQVSKQSPAIDPSILDIFWDYTQDSENLYVSSVDVEFIFDIVFGEEFLSIKKLWDSLTGREKVMLDLTNSHMLSTTELIGLLKEVHISSEDQDNKSPSFSKKTSMTKKTRKGAVSLREDLRMLSILVDECEEIYGQIYDSNNEYNKNLSTLEIRALKKAGLNLLGDYFKKWHATDRFNYIGSDMWEASLRALTTHVSRVSSFRHNEMTNEDHNTYMSIMTRLFKLLSQAEIMPMVEICKALEDKFDTLIDHLPDPAKREIKNLNLSLLYCDNYTQAWQYALRIKGIAYEALFAKDHRLQYIPEMQKPNLTDIIKHGFPMHYKAFMEKSAKRPIIRTLVPDFYSHRKSIFGDEIPAKVKSFIDAEQKQFRMQKEMEERQKRVLENKAVQCTLKEMGAHSFKSDSGEEDDSEKESVSDDEDGESQDADSEGSIVSTKPSTYRVAPSAPYSFQKKHSKSKHTTDSERQKCIELITKGHRQGKVFLGLDILADSIAVAQADQSEQDLIDLLNKKYGDSDKRAPTDRKDVKQQSTEEADEGGEIVQQKISQEDGAREELSSDAQTSDVLSKGTEHDPRTTEEELIIYEVGYVTDAESKMSIDIGKWAAANSILKEIGLQTTLIFTIDSSTRPFKDWWINQTSARAIKSSVGALFRKLIQYTPTEVRERVIGDITTLKYQRMRGSGHIVRTSVNLEDVKTCYNSHKEKIQIRPCGTILPEEIMDDFENSIINGCAISPQGSEDLIQQLKDSSKSIIQIYKNTKEAEVLLENDETRDLVLHSWILQEVSNCYCKSCFIDKTEDLVEPTTRNIQSLVSLLHASNTVSECCEKAISPKPCLGPVPLFSMKCPNLLGVEHPSGSKEDLGQVTELDQIMGTAFPGRTQPQKKFKRAVEKLCRIALDLNGISAIKNSKGQIMLNTSFSSKVSSTVSVPRKVIKPKQLNKVKEQLKVVTANIKDMLKSKEIESYSDFHKGLVLMLINNINNQAHSRCALSEVWVDRVFRSLELTESAAETIVIYNKTITDRQENADKNDSFRPPEDEMLKAYFNYHKESATLTFGKSNLFTLDCLLFKELVQELVRRCAKTTYNMNISAVGDTCKLLLKFGWFQNIVFYSKMCGTYLTACSEFTGSGVKILKIPHTPYNLAIKLSSNKKSNSKCSILDLNMDQILPNFYMNRSIASLGHAMPFVVLVILIQTIQSYRCIDGLTLICDDDEQYIESLLNSYHENFKEVILYAHKGLYWKATDELISLMPKRRNYMSLSPKERMIRVVVSFTIGIGVALVPAMLLNSLNFNSQIQKMRFTVLMGLSMIGRPADMGRKMYASSRRVESYVARTYLQVISYTCLTNIATNITNWKAQALFPEVTMPSISLFGVATSGDRHCLTDIYLVHAFNKELDNFDEGSIAVLEELADRHFSWEKHVTKLINRLNKIKHNKEKGKKAKGESYGKQRSRTLSEIRNLMGVINLKAPIDPDLKEDSTLRFGKSSESTSSRSARSDRKLWDARSRGRESVMSISSTLEAFADEDQEGQYALREKDQCTIYQPSVRKVMKECKRLLIENPNYTMGIGEVLQAMVEFNRTKFPEVVVCHAKRDPKNWASIASVSESTAIVSGPLRRFDIQQCMESTKRMECTKLKKLLKNRLTYLGGPEAKIKNVKTVAKELEELLSCIDVVDDSVKQAVEKGISMARQLKQVTWEQASEMQLEQTVLTNDGHNIYYWIKNLKNTIEKFWKSPSAKELYNDPINLEIINVMKSISLNERPTLTVSEVYKKSGSLFKLWIRVFDELVVQLKLIKSDEEDKFRTEFFEILDDYTTLYNTFRDILILKKQNPDLSYQKLETNLHYLEDSFLSNYSTRLGKYINFLFCACLSCPWSRGFRYQESVYLKTILTTIGLNFGESGGMEEYIATLLPTMGVRQFLSTYFIQRFDCNHLHGVLGAFFRYAIALYSSNSKPMSYVYNKRTDSSIMASHSLIQGVQDVIARSSLYGHDYDFAFTIKIVAYGSHAVAQKITGKSKKERLPRSIRSKVIYEIIKLMGTSGSAILQEVAFEKILDIGHQFFATLAPKAQLGGNRDLFVQETGTKLIHATTEIFSKTLLSQTNDDGLTNSRLKEEILNKSLQQFKLSEEHHGRVLPKDNDDIGGNMINFYKVMTVAGDNTKWGPIHCCSFFSLMYQQLLLDHPDWKHYIMLVMFKDLYKEVEIPTASISKILNSLKHDEKFIKNYKTNTSHRELSSELLRISEKWSWKPLVQDIINNYLSKGVGCLRCFNHMGQGIHHATSSLLTSMLAELVKEIVSRFVESELEGLHCTIFHAGSSDDYAKIIVTNGTLIDVDFDDACYKWKHVMLDAKNLMSAVSRLVQVKDSSKTLSGTILAEFYSEFVLYHRASPAGIKFIITSLINSSITSPITMSQACQVSSQQAFFNSVPHLTNLSFTLFRQQVYFNYVENFIRKFGPITLGSVCSVGRLYLPKISNMLESGLVIEDIEQTVHSLKNLYTGLKNLPEEDFIVAPPGSLHSENISDSDDSDLPVVVSSSLDSDIRGKSRARVFIKALDAGIATEFDKHTDKSTEADGVIDAITQLQDSTYYMECDKIVRLMYYGQNCRHYSKLWHDQLLSRFMKPQPEVVKSLCIPPSGSFEFELIKIDDISYSSTLIEVLMRDVLVAVMFSHYKKPDTLSFGKRLKASYDREESSFYEDPFIQIKPNSLEREMKNIREAHDVVKSIVSNASMANTLSAAVSSCLVKMNNMTEDHLGETERLMQAIRSRSIVWGLSGGLKELSVPMYSIFMNGFFFLDNAKICTEARWASSRREGHMDSVAREIGQRARSKFTFWLETVLSGRLRGIERNYYGVLDSKACVAWFNSMVDDQNVDLANTTLTKGAEDIKQSDSDKSSSTSDTEAPIQVITRSAEGQGQVVEEEMPPGTKVATPMDEEDPLSITSLQRVIKVRKRLFLSLDTGLCEKYARELVSLTLQFSNVNRQKILSLETNQDIIVRPADYTTIVKTKLFNKGSITQTNNNPAVVVAYKLCPESVYSLKPAGVDYSNLSLDGLTIADIHPAISEMCLEIIGKTAESYEFSNEEVHEYTRTLTSLCRLASSHRYSTMSFYAIRPTESSEETNLVEVISYGLQEGKQITFPVANIDLAAYSERFYVILEAIGCINQLPLLNDCKTTIMQNFLTWIPDESGLDVPETCAFSGYKSSLMANFGGSSLASVLLAEQHLSHSQSIMRNCGYLSQYVMGPDSLQSKIPYTGTRPKFSTVGSKESHGNFSYLSPDGNAAGIFVSKKLLIHIDKLSTLLMDNICRHVLGWITGHRIGQLTEEDIKQFLILLPTCRTSDLLVQDKGTGELCHIIKTGSSYSALEVRKGGRKGYPLVYYIENHMKATFEKEQERQPILCDWQSDKLLLYYQVIHDEVRPSQSHLHSINILLGSGLSDYAQMFAQSDQHVSDKIVIATIPLSGAINFKSMGLLHLYLSHIKGHRSHGLGIPIKEAELHRLSTEAAINQITKLKRDFKAYFNTKEIIKERKRDGNKELTLQDFPNQKTEKVIREKLNAVSEHYDRLVDWAAVQNIIKVLSMNNSIVIAESLQLRNRVRWKIVPSTLDPNLLRSEEGLLFRTCMELSSFKVRPIFCRLSFTETGCSKMMKLSLMCKAVLQSEGLSVGSLNTILFFTVLYNSPMVRGEEGIMTITECYHGTLPFTRDISEHCTISCNLEDDTPNMILTLSVPAEKRGTPSTIAVLLSEPFKKAGIQRFGEIWRAVSANLTDKQSTTKKTCLIRYNVIPSLLARHVPYMKMIKLFFPSYNGTSAMGLCCRILKTLLDNELTNLDCKKLALEFRNTEDPAEVKRIISGEVIQGIASGEDILDALDLLDSLEDSTEDQGIVHLTEKEMDENDEREMMEALEYNPYE
nr:RNA-dependent RNA polymerase [Sichuan tick nairovirus]